MLEEIYLVILLHCWPEPGGLDHPHTTFWADDCAVGTGAHVGLSLVSLYYMDETIAPPHTPSEGRSSGCSERGHIVRGIASPELKWERSVFPEQPPTGVPTIIGVSPMFAA